MLIGLSATRIRHKARASSQCAPTEDNYANQRSKEIFKFSSNKEIKIVHISEVSSHMKLVFHLTKAYVLTNCQAKAVGNLKKDKRGVKAKYFTQTNNKQQDIN